MSTHCLLRTFAEICVTADTSNKVGRTKIDTMGRMYMFLGYSTQYAGDVYRFPHMKTNHIIHSRDVQWLGKMWHDFHSVPSNHCADAYVDPFDDYIEENGTGQEVEENVQEKQQVPVEEEDVHVSSLEEEEPIAARTRSHDSQSISTRTRSQQD